MPDTADDSYDLFSIHQVLAGSPKAFEKLVVKYQQPIMRLALAFLWSIDDAEDAVQEIFVKAYKSLPGFSLYKRFYPWLYSIALNHLKNTYRKNKRQSALRKKIKTMPVRDYPSPDSTLAEKADIEAVRLGINLLPERLRQVTVLYYLEEMNIAEIDEVLGLGQENIKSRLYRARKKLRKYFSEYATNAGE